MNAKKLPASVKPLVGTSAIERMLLRHVFAVTPESRLLVAVIGLALRDVALHSGYHRKRARRFLNSKVLDNYAELIGLEPEFVREVARKTGYLDNYQKSKNTNKDE